MVKNRVALSGISIMGQNVSTKDDLWGAISVKNPNWNIVKEKINGSVTYRNSGSIENFNTVGYFPPIMAKQADIATQYAIVSSMQALNDAGIEITEDNADDIGLFMGTEWGGFSYAEKEYRNYVNRGFRYLSPYLCIGMFFSAPIGQLSILLKLKGYCKTYVAGECSSSIAIGEAYRRIKQNQARVIVAGGYDKNNTESSTMVYHSKGALATGSSQVAISKSVPYAEDSQGMILSDGVGMVVLQNWDDAIKNSAKIYGEIVGFSQGFSSDQNEDDLKYIINTALDDAGIPSKNIDYIHGSGMGIPEWDSIEKEVIQKIFGESAVWGAPGSNLGNSLGAYGVTSLISSLECLNKESFITYNGNIISINPEKSVLNILVLTRSLEGTISVLVVRKDLDRRTK